LRRVVTLASCPRVTPALTGYEPFIIALLCHLRLSPDRSSSIHRLPESRTKAYLGRRVRIPLPICYAELG
jgi:hypothetical protein